MYAKQLILLVLVGLLSLSEQSKAPIFGRRTELDLVKQSPEVKRVVSKVSNLFKSSEVEPLFGFVQLVNGKKYTIFSLIRTDNSMEVYETAIYVPFQAVAPANNQTHATGLLSIPKVLSNDKRELTEVTLEEVDILRYKVMISKLNAEVSDVAEIKAYTLEGYNMKTLVFYKVNANDEKYSYIISTRKSRKPIFDI